MVKLLDRICQPLFVMGSKVQGSKVWGFALRATTPQAGFRVQEFLVAGNWSLAPGHRSLIAGRLSKVYWCQVFRRGGSGVRCHQVSGRLRDARCGCLLGTMRWLLIVLVLVLKFVLVIVPLVVPVLSKVMNNTS